MNLRVLFILALSTLTSVAFAQQNEWAQEKVVDKHKVEVGSAKENWFISVGAGASAYFGMKNSEVEFHHSISPSINLSVGKWITHTMGVRFQYSGIFADGATDEMESPFVRYQGDQPYQLDGHPGLYLVRCPYFTLHGDFLLNLTSLIGGYKEERLWNTVPYVGLGIVHGWQMNKNNDAFQALVGRDATNKVTSLAANFGWLNSFRISPAVDLNIELSEVVVADSFEHNYSAFGKSGESLLSLTVGMTYKFKPRGFRQSTYSERITDSDTDRRAMQAKVDSLLNSNSKLESDIAEATNNIVDVVDTLTLAQQIRFTAACMVTFPLGISTLQDEAKLNLKMFSETAKATPKEKKFVLTGYADASTGTVEINERLSRERSQAVYDYLVNELGIETDRLEVRHKGGVENMFYDDPTLSRSVIITIEDK